MHERVEPIADDEIVYRRVSSSANPSQLDAATQVVSDQAFAPHKTRDTTGISVWRAIYKTATEVARGQLGKTYYVIGLRAGDLRARGIAVEPKPETPNGYDIAHAELPGLNSGNYKDDATQELQRLLVSLIRESHGPFHT